MSRPMDRARKVLPYFYVSCWSWWSDEQGVVIQRLRNDDGMRLLLGLWLKWPDQDAIHAWEWEEKVWDQREHEIT